MIHIWLPNPQAQLRVWQDSTQSWHITENWQAVRNFIALQHVNKDKVACLYFPSMYLLKIQPKLNNSQLKALGDTGRQYLFEEVSISPVDDLQVKIQPNSANNETTQLFALHASDREQWLNTANLAGVKIVALLPDFTLLPTPPSPPNAKNNQNSAVFYQDFATKLINYGTNNQANGMAINQLAITLSKLPQLEYLYLTGDIEAQTIAQLQSLPNLQYQTLEAIPNPVKDPSQHFFNFSGIKKDSFLDSYTKTILFICLGVLILQFSIDGLRWYHYQKAEKQAKNLLKEQYQQWFPNENFNPRLNIQRQLSGKLINQQEQNQTNVLTVLNNIQPLLRQNQIIAKQLNYQNNQIQLQLTTNHVDNFNRLVQSLNAQGINAKLGNVNANPNQGAIADVQISL